MYGNIRCVLYLLSMSVWGYMLGIVDYYDMGWFNCVISCGYKRILGFLYKFGENV